MGADSHGETKRVTLAGWVAIVISVLGVVGSVCSFAVLLGRRDSELDRAREDITALKGQVEKSRVDSAAELRQARADLDSHADLLAQSREASEKEIAQFLGDLKQFMANQSAVNQAVARTLDNSTARLQQIGDMVMQQSAIVGMHTEVMRAKGLIGG